MEGLTVEGDDIVTVRCEECGTRLGVATGDVFAAVNVVRTQRRRRAKRGQSGGEVLADSLTLTPPPSPPGSWYGNNDTAWERGHVSCPNRECRRQVSLTAIASRVAEARRRGVTTIKVRCV